MFLFWRWKTHNFSKLFDQGTNKDFKRATYLTNGVKEPKVFVPVQAEVKNIYEQITTVVEILLQLERVFHEQSFGLLYLLNFRIPSPRSGFAWIHTGSSLWNMDLDKKYIIFFIFFGGLECDGQWAIPLLMSSIFSNPESFRSRQEL